MHPRYKTKYRVGNWPAYDRALVQRGDVTLWLTPEAIATWEAVGVGKRGGQLQYSEVAIETALTLRLIFHLPLRQTEGFLRSIFGMLCLDLSAPDHTTLSRRGQHLDRLIFHLISLRQTEGFLRSIFGMLCLDLSAPDHTTLFHGVVSTSTLHFAASPRAQAYISSSTVPGSRLWVKVNGRP